MVAPAAAAPRRRSAGRLIRSLTRWLLGHFLAAASLAAHLLGGALLAALWRRRLVWRAVLAGLLAYGAGLVATLWTLVGRAGPWAGTPLSSRGASGPFVVGLGLAACLGLAVTARARGRLGLAELQASWLVVLALGTVALLRPLGPWWWQAAPPWTPRLGEAAFGPLWDRLLALYAAAGGLAAVWGASSALTLGLGAGGGARARPTWRLEGFLTWRSLRGRHAGDVSATARVAVLGVALGVAALLVVTAVMSGYQRDIEGRILRTNAHLVLQKYGADFAEWPALLPRLQAVEGVGAAAPFVFNEALLAVRGTSHSILLKGLAPGGAEVTALAEQLCTAVDGQGGQANCITLGEPVPEPPAAVAAASTRQPAAQPSAGPTGAPPTVPTGRALYVGLSLYRALDVPLGTPVQAMAPASLGPSGQRAPRRESFVLAGVFRSGMHEFDSHLAYVALPAAQSLLGLGETVSGIELRLDDPMAVGVVGARVLEAAEHYPFRVLDWRTLNGSIFTALTLQKVVMFLLLSFIVVVASFNIASTLLMAVMQKSGQVAVLKSMGARDVTVLRLFVFEGLTIGLVGCSLGLVLGLATASVLGRLELGIAADVYMVGSLQVALDAREVLATLGVAFAICQLSTLAPALRAAQLPVQRLFDEA